MRLSSFSFRFNLYFCGSDSISLFFGYIYAFFWLSFLAIPLVITFRVKNQLFFVMKKKILPGEINELKRQKLCFKDIFLEWTASVSFHGFPKIFLTKYTTIRIIVINYLKYEVVTTIKVIEKDSLPFPAVTVCNANPFVSEEGLKYVSSFLEENNLTHIYDSELNNFGEKNDQEIFSNNTFNRFMVTTLSKGLKTEKKKIFSLGLKEILISCMFNLQQCSENDWEWYYDYFYGNCHRFNTGKNLKGEKIDIKYTNNAGKYNGLMVELFTGIPNNHKTLSLTNGAHVFIDDNSFKPITQGGYDVATGFSTNLAIERIKTKLMPQPYSECIQNLDSIDSFDSEYYRKVFRSNLLYRQSDCFEAFQLSEIYKNCSCDEMGNNLVYENNNTCDTFTEQLCAITITQKLLETNFKQKNKLFCPLECESIRYKVIKSENNYPSESYGNDLSKTSKIRSLFENRSNISNEELRKNVLAVSVYYEYSEQTEISQSASISWEGLVGIIGGTLGLFLGMSFLSFVEFFDLFLQIIFKKS
ncbi:acid-sensing ion channel 2 isoform X1 [Brachionus plicatilis]|uniref:Acid-sensing ion channel 2 isoform X1 n=1 Tax=Brachionus plicatilis TaxID=10195 RepID=A0A3M7SL26_BRAPC|nr:acid-sensing ion channel 2 isoform X1 [Brachionus plicatilis]